MFSDDKLTVLWNIYLRDHYKIDRLKESISRLIKVGFYNHALLLRGPLSHEGSLKIQELQVDFPKANLTVEFKEKCFDWKMNTLLLLNKNYSTYILLMQEDHLLMDSGDVLLKYISECIEMNIDVSPVSAFRTYLEQRLQIALKKNSILTEYGTYSILEKGWHKQFDLPRYAISLVALYNRKLLVEILKTPYPFFKRYPPFTPFDFEQHPSVRWYLPVAFALPNRELFACVDDDIGIPGSSLQNRGLYPLDNIRKDEHNISKTSLSATDLIFSFIHRSQGNKLSLLATSVFGIYLKKRLIDRILYMSRIIDSLMFTIKWWACMMRRRHIIVSSFRLRTHCTCEDSH